MKPPKNDARKHGDSIQTHLKFSTLASMVPGTNHRTFRRNVPHIISKISHTTAQISALLTIKRYCFQGAIWTSEFTPSEDGEERDAKKMRDETGERKRTTIIAGTSAQSAAIIPHDFQDFPACSILFSTHFSTSRRSGPDWTSLKTTMGRRDVFTTGF